MGLFASEWIGDVAHWLTTRGLSHVVRSAQGFIQSTLENVVEEVRHRVKKLALTYAIGAGLALVAVVQVFSALADGLVALGMLPWASHLLLAVSTGIVAWVSFKRAAATPAGEDSDQEPDPAGGMTIKIVNVHRGAKKSSPWRPKKRRVVRVERTAWKVTTGKPRRKGKVFRTKKRAVKAAASIARKRSARVVVPRSRGRARKAHRFTGVA